MAYYDVNLFKKYGKIVGYYEGSVPCIMTSDVKFLKNALIKDVDSFRNRRVIKYPRSIK
jgi:hypothetical protein